jgi:hypothetical protein
MYPRKLTTLLLLPSLFSGSFAVFLSAAIITFTNWAYVSPSNPSYGHLFGPYGLTTIFQESTNALAAINGIFSSPLAYNLSVILFALFIGLLIYVLLEGVDHIAASAHTAISEVELINDPVVKKRMKVESEVRLGLRAGSLVVWIIYLIFFARVIVPLCILLGRLDTNHLLSGVNILKILGAFALLTLALHIHAIFMRLLVLRPRLFGQQNVIVGRGGHEE